MLRRRARRAAGRAKTRRGPLVFCRSHGASSETQVEMPQCDRLQCVKAQISALVFALNSAGPSKWLSPLSLLVPGLCTPRTAVKASSRSARPMFILSFHAKRLCAVKQWREDAARSQARTVCSRIVWRTVAASRSPRSDYRAFRANGLPSFCSRFLYRYPSYGYERLASRTLRGKLARCLQSETRSRAPEKVSREMGFCGDRRDPKASACFNPNESGTASFTLWCTQFAFTAVSLGTLQVKTQQP